VKKKNINLNERKIVNQNVSTYLRQLESIKAEQILSKSKIFIDTNSLRPHLIGKPNQGDVYRYMKNASQGGGYISTEYSSRGKITNRMFTKKGHLNLITLSNKIILKSIKSRYEDGFIVVLDYKNYEPTIMRQYLDLDFCEDLHTWASELLRLDRSIVKTYNMAILYGKSFDTQILRISKELTNDHGCKEYNMINYLGTMEQLNLQILKYVDSVIESFKFNGFIVNLYGRKIYPKDASNIFSNEIQSVGSEILVDAIIKIDELLNEKGAHLLFHRFDALYFDISKSALRNMLPKIIKLMESANPDINLTVGIQLGKDLTSLKELDIG